MTLTILTHDPRTGDFGAAIASSSPAVAARCLHLAGGVGAASSQNVTDPRLGQQLIARLRDDATAQDAVDHVVAHADPRTIDYRQLLVLDRSGNAATYNGQRTLGTHGTVVRDGIVAGGNLLSSPDVLDAMVETAASAPGLLEERLLAALQAAVRAGGEAGPVHSAGLAVASAVGWNVTDLRVDWAASDPVDALGLALDLWLPQRDDYVRRAVDPAGAPTYGVPGDH